MIKETNFDTFVDLKKQIFIYDILTDEENDKKVFL